MTKDRVIPKRLHEGFSIIFNSNKKKIELLISALREIPKGQAISDLPEYLIAKEVFNGNESAEVAELLQSLYSVKFKSLTNKNLDETVEDIFEDLKGIENANFKIKEDYKNYFKELLSIDNIGVTLKALILSNEYDKIYVESRIVTDIRPSFDDNLENKIAAAVIVHNLKIEFHKGQSPFHEEIYLALDDSDLNELGEQIIRAQKKEKTIKATLKDNISFIKTNTE